MLQTTGSRLSDGLFSGECGAARGHGGLGLRRRSWQCKEREDDFVGACVRSGLGEVDFVKIVAAEFVLRVGARGVGGFGLEDDGGWRSGRVGGVDGGVPDRGWKAVVRMAMKLIDRPFGLQSMGQYRRLIFMLDGRARVHTGSTFNFVTLAR